MDTQGIPSAPLNQPISGSSYRPVVVVFTKLMVRMKLMAIEVVNDDTVTWRGVANNGIDVVYISDIDYESGANLFGSTDLTPPSYLGPVVIGTVQNADNPGLVETYKIKFQVFVGGQDGPKGYYEIDPKITVSAGHK